MLPADREFFWEHGWLVVRQAVTPERVALLERAFDRMFPPPEAQTDAISQILNTSRYRDPFSDWILDDVGAYVAGVLGCERVRLLQDTLLLKRAQGGGRVEWHQDYNYTAFLEGARAAAVRLSLTECSVASGCLHVMDRSHRWGHVGAAAALPGSKVVSALPPERAAEASCPLELRPGDLSIHHSLTFHGSFENTSALPRKTIVVHAYDARSLVDRSRVPAAKAALYPTDPAGRMIGPAYPVIYGSKQAQ